ncbi:hypothetical protein Tco_1345330 [Tanacetum coccineum]
MRLGGHSREESIGLFCVALKAVSSKRVFKNLTLVREKAADDSGLCLSDGESRELCRELSALDLYALQLRTRPSVRRQIIVNKVRAVGARGRCVRSCVCRLYFLCRSERPKNGVVSSAVNLRMKILDALFSRSSCTTHDPLVLKINKHEEVQNL